MTETKLSTAASTLKGQNCRVLQSLNSIYLAHHTTKTLTNIYSKVIFLPFASVTLFKHKPKDKIISKGYFSKADFPLLFPLIYLPPTQYSGIMHHIIILLFYLPLLTSQQLQIPHLEKLLTQDSLIYTNIQFHLSCIMSLL